MGGRENGEESLANRKARGGNVTKAGENIMDFLVQPALCHLPVGKTGG
jgi:hypothetical protein